MNASLISMNSQSLRDSLIISFPMKLVLVDDENKKPLVIDDAYHDHKTDTINMVISLPPQIDQKSSLSKGMNTASQTLEKTANAMNFGRILLSWLLVGSLCQMWGFINS